MNICYLIDVSPARFTGGGQIHLTNLIRQMQNLKRPGLSPAGRPGLNIFGGQNSHLVIRLCWMFYVIPQVIFHYFFKQKFNLIHAHSIPAMASGKILSLILGIPIVVTIHGAWMRTWLEKFVLTKIKYDIQITVSRNFLGVTNINKNVVYIPNGVEIGKFTKLPINGRRFVNFRTPKILFVGRKNDPAKGFKVLEEAMKPVKLEIPNTKLLVAGGNLPPEKVLSLYQKADLFVLPSLSEGFPLTLLEAWAAKLPVVATAVGEIPYLFGLRSFANFSSEVCETARGYMVKPGNSKSLAQGIIRALKNPGLAKMGENGYNVAKNYKWSKIARSTLKVYESVILSE